MKSKKSELVINKLKSIFPNWYSGTELSQAIDVTLKGLNYYTNPLVNDNLIESKIKRNGKVRTRLYRFNKSKNLESKKEGLESKKKGLESKKTNNKIFQIKEISIPAVKVKDIVKSRKMVNITKRKTMAYSNVAKEIINSLEFKSNIELKQLIRELSDLLSVGSSRYKKQGFKGTSEIKKIIWLCLDYF